MPWIPPKIIPNQPIPGVLTGYTNGTIYNMDYTLHLNAIIAELNQIGFMLSPQALLDVGSVAASMSSASLNLGIIAENVADIHLEVKKLNLNLQGVSNSVEVSTKGLANISTHMAKQSVLMTMQVNDQMKTSEFQKQVTNQAQESAGQEKTVVTPAAFTEKAKEVISDVSSTNALVAGTSFVQEQISTTATTAFTTTTEWIAESAFGVWIKDAYAKTEIAVVGLFSEAKAKVLADKLKVKANNIKSGGT